MSGNESQNPLDEFVLVVTIPDSAADRVMPLLLAAGIVPGGGGGHGVTGMMVQRRHRAAAKEIIAKDAEEHGYPCHFCDDR